MYRSLLLVLSLSVLLSPLVAAQSISYTYTPIEVPGAVMTSASKINAKGQVVGGYYDGRTSRSYLWEKDVFTRIDVPGSIHDSALGINRDGQIVGTYVDTGGVEHGFLWDNGTVTSIDPPGVDWAQALGINNDRQIVGFYVDTNLLGHGYLWEDSTFSIIDHPDAAYNTTTNDINEQDQIVGWHDGDRGHNFLLRKGAFTTLIINIPGATYIQATGINNRGWIVGEYWDAPDAGTLHGFLATPVMVVTIDIKPGSDTNLVNLRSKGVIPVAILSTNAFDATTVDPLSVAFGPDGTREAHGKGHIKDANKDGKPDLVLHFNTQATGIACGDRSASLTGQTFSEETVEGSDDIRTVNCQQPTDHVVTQGPVRGRQ